MSSYSISIIKSRLTQGFRLNSSISTTLAITALMFLVVAFPQISISYIARLTQYTIDQFGLSFVLFSSVMVLLTFSISLSPLGKIRLGGDMSKPEFSTSSWLAMLFTAGMGSGLIFWGIAEPSFHASNLPSFAKNLGDDTDTALALTYFHWGLHAWSIYAIAALAIAWFSYNRKRTLHISSMFTSQPKRGIFSILDWMAVIAIMFGVAGTFANAIALIQTGLEQTFSIVIDSFLFRYSLLIMIAFLFTTSSLLGLKKGIKRLSLFNTIIMLAMVGAVFVLVDPVQTLERIASSSIRYIELLPQVSFAIDPQSRDWSLGWTVTYLVWWIAWAPFVGPFIARISKGRTIRQFLICVVLVPTFASIIWFSTFGGASLDSPFSANVVASVNNDYTKGLFTFFEQFPVSKMFGITALILLITFIITSADSALLVCTMLTNNDNNKTKILWAAILVSLSTALLYGNDVELNKQVAIAGAIPFTLVIALQVLALLKDMLRNKQC
ncbi:BCCT family transporter [Vibrio pectenicida]|nr:BCCT family transporter [Vibrio pectenicida]